MSRRKFSHLLEKYQRGECTSVEKKFVEYWFGLIETVPAEEEKDMNWAQLEEKMWASMQDNMATGSREKPRPTSVFRISTIKWLSAASVLLMASYVFFHRPSLDKLMSTKQRSGIAWVTRENRSAQLQKVLLTDGSVVELWPNSTLSFHDHFAEKEREVRLTGKAFFSIKRDTLRPFYVRSGQIVTKVLGTSFYVEAGSAIRNPKVEVVTGTVAVYEKPESGSRLANNVLLTANQQATFHAGQHQFISSLIDNPKLLNPETNVFRFRNTPLSEIVEILRKSYGVEIVIGNRDMRSCTLTADLTGQPLYTQLDIICAAVAGSYKVRNTTIVIGGKGCSGHSS